MKSLISFGYNKTFIDKKYCNLESFPQTTHLIKKFWRCILCCKKMVTMNLSENHNIQTNVLPIGYYAHR